MKKLLPIKALDFLQNESKGINRKLLFLIVVSGISNALLLALVNNSIDAEFMKNSTPKNFIYFILSITLFVYSLRYIMYNSSKIIEEGVNNVRIRLISKLLKCPLSTLENIGGMDVYTSISKETSSISKNMRAIFMAAQSFIMVICTISYIAIISLSAFFISLVMIFFVTYIYLKNRKKLEENLYQASKEEGRLFNIITDILQGFKELKMSSSRSGEIRNYFSSKSNEVCNIRTSVMLEYANNYVFAETFFYVLIGTIVFILPVISSEFSDTIVKVVTAILFLIGPLTTTVMQIPIISEVELSVDNIYSFEGKLDRIMEEVGTDIDNSSNFSDFKEILFKDASFSYKGSDNSILFTAGPFNFNIKRGEVVFIVGGNGSGKTTLLKMLTALYLADSGCVNIDGTTINTNNSQSYRELFSVIFSDFHLFRNLFGIKNVDEEKVRALLKLMEIEHKTDFTNNAFTNISLSTGQRKRLALIVTYLENKDIYVFDEWAADQDPHFRKYFYYTLVPDLKKRGKTVIAVSHDDRYFSCADRVITLDFGKITESKNS